MIEEEEEEEARERKELKLERGVKGRWDGGGTVGGEQGNKK